MKVIEHTYKWKRNITLRKKTTRIILHCSATPEGREIDVQTIHKWHLAKDWAGIGYNYIIYADGSIHRGRPKGASGAHTTNLNHTSIGICYIGGMDKENKKAKDTRTQAQKDSMMWLVKVLMPQYGLTLNDVHGHYEFANKACPSFKIEKFREEYKEKYSI